MKTSSVSTEMELNNYEDESESDGDLIGEGDSQTRSRMIWQKQLQVKSLDSLTE